MQGFNKCNNGHFYKEHLSQCPYCQGGNSNQNLGETVENSTLGSTQMGFGSTEKVPSSADDFAGGDKTKVFGGGGGVANTDKRTSSVDIDINERTFIGGVHPTNKSGETVASDGNDSKNQKDNGPRATRKMVGWLVSYTIDPMGIDYRIFEGNNPIGRDTNNSIILLKDPTISGKHLNILFRQGKFWAKDEMSANGSFINGEEMEISKPYDLQDGDTLKLGDTVFKFKSSI